MRNLYCAAGSQPASTMPRQAARTGVAAAALWGTVTVAGLVALLVTLPVPAAPPLAPGLVQIERIDLGTWLIDTPAEGWLAAVPGLLLVSTLVVLLALAGLYTVMTVTNAVVIAGTGSSARARRRATARSHARAGRRNHRCRGGHNDDHRPLLGLVVVAGAVLAIALEARRSVGEAMVEIPWALLVATTVGMLVVSITVSSVVSYLVTRSASVALTAARE